MNEPLQELFIKSQGLPVKVGDTVVLQAGRIPIRNGVISITFLSTQNPDQGVCLKAKGGAIHLSDGCTAERVHVWNTPGLPRTIKHEVDCPNGDLVLWNIYRIRHHSGAVTEDQWTGNAGMVLLKESSHMRRYACSDWKTPFDPSALEFEIGWEDCAKEKKEMDKRVRKGSVKKRRPVSG